MYNLCTAPTFSAPDVISQIDSKWTISEERILNVAMDEISWAQISLPVKMGGSGLQNMIDLSSSAYLSSEKANSLMVGRLLNDHAYELPIDTAIATWFERSHATPPDTQTSKQKSWIEPIHRHTKMRLLQRTSDTELARYKASDALVQVTGRMHCLIKFGS